MSGCSTSRWLEADSGVGECERAPEAGIDLGHQPVRETPSRFAARSTRRKVSSESEMAVFTA
jgi:hypothetical protein